LEIKYSLSIILYYKKDLGNSFREISLKEDKGISFELSHEKIKGRAALKDQPLDFLFEGLIEHAYCDVNHPLKGYIIPHKYNYPLQSLEIQLVRIETYKTTQETLHEGTEIQNIQIADGDVPIGVKLPIFMILPRYYSCTSFDVEEVSVIFM